jgi:hypothetical protein
LLTGLPAYTQEAIEKNTNEFGVWGGGSFDSPTLIGTAEDRKFFIMGLRYGRVLATSERVAFEYTVDVIPAAVVFQPQGSRFTSAGVDRGSASIYGAGVAPIGLKLYLRRQKRVKPFVDGSAGFLYFREPVPVNTQGATKFNWTFDFGGGIQVSTGERRAITVGYKLHHISNAGRSEINPGLDANLFYVGFSIFR